MVDKVGTIEHEVTTDRYEYSNISSKESRFVPPKWMIARYKDKNIPPYTYPVRT